MPKISKSMRMEEDLINIIKEKGKGVDFTDKLHNALNTYFTEEEKILSRIKELEKREKQIKERISGLEKITNLSKSLFLQTGNLLESIGRGNKYSIDSTMEDLSRTVDSIKKVV